MAHTAEHGGTVPPTVTKPEAPDDAGDPLDDGRNQKTAHV